MYSDPMRRSTCISQPVTPKYVVTDPVYMRVRSKDYELRAGGRERRGVTSDLG